jgi:Ca2+-binding RTX toxin-like protein
MQPLFQDLYNSGVDLVLGGHAHNYERFAPQDPNGKLDRARGIQQFVVGTGGAFFTSVGSPKPNSEVRQNSTYGVLFLTLHPTSYDWVFVPEAGKSFTDRGSQACHDLVPMPPAADVPAARSQPRSLARVSSSATVTPSDCDLFGTPGPDVLVGTDAAEVMCGMGGDDRIRAGGGDDVILGGDGDDRISAGPGNDRVLGEVGRDRVRAGAGDDFVRGGRGRDTIFGGAGNDELHGNYARDTVRGQSGNDRISGEGGRNRLFGNLGNDVLFADRNRRGGDHVNGGRGRDRAHVNRGDYVRLALRRL